RVQPAHAVLAEQLLPVDVAGLELAGRRVATVRAADGAAEAEAALREVESVAHRAPDAVVLDPLDVRLVDAALVDEVLDEPPHGVVGEGRDDRRLEPEAAPQTARDVVLAAALPGLERARRRDPPVARVEAEHDLAERDEVEAA